MLNWVPNKLRNIELSSVKRKKFNDTQQTTHNVIKTSSECPRGTSL